MKSTIGTMLQVTLFGESHGPCIGIVMNGVPHGIQLDIGFIQKQMKKRSANNPYSTNRIETDEVQIVSGVFQGYTTGAPLTIMIQNHYHNSKHYETLKTYYRPSHSDYTYDIKYEGFQDYRGGGHGSGRLTAPLVAAGAIALQILATKNIKIATHILKCQELMDRSFYQSKCIEDEIHILQKKTFCVLDDEIEAKIKDRILYAKTNKDSIGGILESVILNLPPGIGEPFFHSIESIISHYLYSIPAVKGVSFGLGFEFKNFYGSQINDAFIQENNKIKTTSNYNGGINGGISNGMPILVNTAIKPTPSIYKTQTSMNRKTKKNESFQIQGNHDPAIFHRATVVIDSMLALATLDLMLINQRSFL